MNFPAIALKNFERLKGNSFFGGVFNSVSKLLKNIIDPSTKSRIFHQQVDEYLGKVLDNPVAKAHLSCKKGCSACCHTQVSVTSFEAQQMAKLIKNKKIPINSEKLLIQAQAQNDSQAWYRLSYANRGCVFLDQNNQCSIYEDRPAVCRTNYVFNPPDQCSTVEGKERSLQMLKTEMADMAVMAGFFASEGNGTLPFMLWKTLLEIHKRPHIVHKNSKDNDYNK